MKRKWLPGFLCLIFLSMAASGRSAPAADRGTPILWQMPADIESRDLYHGPGGPDGVPKAPFVFLKEDLAGTNPKFDVRDANGVKWKVKLGIEARPEVAAARLLWAVGYFTQENYFVSNWKCRICRHG
jgi:hypothetical protein